jgi:hypothetical protein
MLCYTILCYIILYYIILCYVILYYVILYYIMLCYIILCYIILYYIIFARITAITRALTCLPVEPTATARETGMENTWAQTTEAVQDS